jgi:hypothetical protein
MNLNSLKRLIYILCSLCLVLLSSCAANKATLNPQAQLEKELNKWQSFHMEGIAEIQASAFSIRKYYVVQKYSKSIQLDIVNSGLMGAQPTPLLSVKVDSTLTIESPYQDMIQAMFKRSGLNRVNLQKYLDFKSIFRDSYPEIISTGKTTLGNFEFKFTKDMMLYQIISKDKKQKIDIIYRDGKPHIINIEMDKLANIQMQVEQFVNTTCCDSLINSPTDNK